MKLSGTANRAYKYNTALAIGRKLAPGLSILWAYAAISLFDPWRFVPFWVQSSALGLTLLFSFLIARWHLNPARAEGASDSSSKPITMGKPLTGLLLASVVGLIIAGERWDDRLINSFIFQLEESPKTIALSVRIIPPSYTGQTVQTILRPEDGAYSTFSIDGPVMVPAGSVLEVAIASGSRTPVLSHGSNSTAFEQQEDGDFFIRLKTIKPDQYGVRVGPYVEITWQIDIKPDNPPSVSFLGQPSATGSHFLRVNYVINDDYGVEKAYMMLRRAGSSSHNIVEFDLSRANDNILGEANKTALLDFSSHLWAGSTVFGRLVVEDALGQRSSGEEIRFILPEREFSHPVARNLVSIRRSLLLNPERIKEAARRLEIQVHRPVDFDSDLSVFVWLRSAYWSLTLATDQDVVDEVIQILWQTAIRLEDNIRAAQGEPSRNILDQMMGEN